MRYPRSPKMSVETSEEIALFQWLAPWKSRYPQLGNIIHIPNEGKRSRAAGGIAKAMGMRAGVWDILCLGTRAYLVIDGEIDVRGGLWIEMKAPGEGLSPEQVTFQKENLDSYEWHIAHDWLSAVRRILAYYQLEENAELLYALPADSVVKRTLPLKKKKGA